MPDNQLQTARVSTADQELIFEILQRLIGTGDSKLLLSYVERFRTEMDDPRRVVPLVTELLANGAIDSSKIGDLPVNLAEFRHANRVLAALFANAVVVTETESVCHKIQQLYESHGKSLTEAYYHESDQLILDGQRSINQTKWLHRLIDRDLSAELGLFYSERVERKSAAPEKSLTSINTEIAREAQAELARLDQARLGGFFGSSN